MAKHIVLFKLKGETLARMIEHPSDRVAVLSRLCERLGGKLETYYWMFGQFDGFVIVESPDSITAAGASMAAASTGAFSHVETHELIAAGDIDAALAKARSALETYQPPGS